MVISSLRHNPDLKDPMDDPEKEKWLKGVSKVGRYTPGDVLKCLVNPEVVCVDMK